MLAVHGASEQAGSTPAYLDFDLHNLLQPVLQHWKLPLLLLLLVLLWVWLLR
jgi:hypothetical protein